jgi:DNA-binding NarL/FixJ family response regulator
MGLKQILTDAFKRATYGEARNAQEALDLIWKQDWDVVVLDITMPGRSGLDVLREIKKSKPRLPVLVLSMHPENQFAVRVLKSGASGYMTKESAPDELVGAVKKVLAGGRYVSNALAENLAASLSANQKAPQGEALGPRVSSAAAHRLRQNGHGYCPRIVPQRQNHQHLPFPHFGKDGHEKQRRTDALCHPTSAGRIGRS